MLYNIYCVIQYVVLYNVCCVLQLCCVLQCVFDNMGMKDGMNTKLPKTQLLKFIKYSLMQHKLHIRQHMLLIYQYDGCIKKTDYVEYLDINGSKLQRVKCVKYLGLMVDQKLKWIDHIAHVRHKVAHGLGIINKPKHFSTTIGLRNLYY